MYIADIDKNVTKVWMERNERKEKRETYEKRHKLCLERIEEDIVHPGDDPEIIYPEDDPVDQEEYSPPITTKENNTEQNRLDMFRFLDELDRYCISDAAGAALATSLLEDIGWVNSENKKLVFDKYKIRRQRIKSRKERKKRKELDLKGKIKCIGVDGRRDKTKVMIETEINKSIIEIKDEITEEHNVFTDPKSYISHSVIEHGQSNGIGLGRHLVDIIREFDSEDSVECVVCDGTSTMTGCYNGLIASAEREMNKELQWCICQLHGNETPMRHLFQYLDGGHGTSGPKSFHGPIGKALTSGNCHLKDTIQFIPIKAPDLLVLPDEVVRDLSRDQWLLYKYSKAVDNGIVPTELARQKPGGINHSRWLTFCLTALIEYTRDDSPSPNKIKFITYIQKVYVPGWFIIKTNPKLQQGAKNVFSIMQLVKTQPKEIQDVVKKVCSD